MVPWVVAVIALAAVAALIEGAPWSRYLRATVVSLVATAVLVLPAGSRVERREQ